MVAVQLGNVVASRERSILTAFDVNGDAQIELGREAPVDIVERLKAGPRSKGVHVTPIVERIAQGRLRYIQPADLQLLATQGWDRRLAARIDHTLLAPAATLAAIEKLCEEAVVYGFRSVCIMPDTRFVKHAAKLLIGSDVKIACVIGFPSGKSSTRIKKKEAAAIVSAIRTAGKGTVKAELDMVANAGYLVNGFTSPEYFRAYHDDILHTVKQSRISTKVILLTEVLRQAAEKNLPENATEEEKEKAGDEYVYYAGTLATAALREAGIEGCALKNGDGVYSKKTTARDIRTMKEASQGLVRIKGAGGMSTAEEADAIVAAGADILGVGTPKGIAMVTSRKGESSEDGGYG